MNYLILKWIHILSSTVLFGTGVGLAFYFFTAHRIKEIHAIKFTTRVVVMGDLLFTTPAGIVQFISGLALMHQAGFAFDEPWLMLSIGLFVFAGLCWLPVVWIQIKMRDLAATAENLSELPDSYWSLNRWWIGLGTLAFPALVAVFWLMVVKPEF